MSDRFNVVTPRKNKNTDKTYWHKIGIAFNNSNGMSIKLESLPLPDDNGEVWLNLFPQEIKHTEHDPKPASNGRDAIPF